MAIWEHITHLSHSVAAKVPENEGVAEISKLRKRLGIERPKAGRPWRAVALAAGSALLGGIAVSLWNRRTLHDIRKAVGETAERPVEEDRDEDFVG